MERRLINEIQKKVQKERSSRTQRKISKGSVSPSSSGAPDGIKPLSKENRQTPMMCANPYMRSMQGMPTKHLSDSNLALAVTPFRCGHCLPCRILNARIWQHRIILESKLHKYSTFYTCTYNDDKINRNDHGTPVLNDYDHTNFMKILRKKIAPRKIRFYMVGEYGRKSWRPHFHYILFGIKPSEKKLLDSVWKYGHTTVGLVEKKSAGYIAGYCVKKFTKNEEKLHGRPPEFARMSNRPGIGADYMYYISERMQKEYSNVEPGIVRALSDGKRDIPLGRYLTKKLANELGFTDDDFRKELWKYQDDMFEKNLPGSKAYYFNIVEEKKEERKKQESKHKYLKPKESL